MTNRRRPHPLDASRDADLDLIGKIADRAVNVYAQNGVRVDRLTILMDLTACHFSGQKLRLEDLLEADDLNFAHDVGGINRHLDRETYALGDGFSPRFAWRRCDEDAARLAWREANPDAGHEHRQRLAREGRDI